MDRWRVRERIGEVRRGTDVPLQMCSLYSHSEQRTSLKKERGLTLPDGVGSYATPTK
jgi:hypothetical protein